MAVSKTNWWKLGCFLLAAFLILILLNNSCKNTQGFLSGCNGKRDTLDHKIDTAITRIEKDTVYVPKPYKVDSFIFVGVPKPYKVIEYPDQPTGPVDHPEYLPITPERCCDELRQFGISYYNDSFQISKGNKVRVTDTVRGRILGRRIFLEKTDTAIKETITLSQPKKFQMLFGVSLLGNPKDPFHMAGAKLTFKYQNERQYFIGYKRQLQDGINFYEIGTDIPIRIFNPKKK